MVETRRKQIESAASVLFRERGYPGTSVRDIARTVEIQGGSLYAHVASKEDLLWSIVERAANRFDAALDGAENPGNSAATRLRDLARAHVSVVTEDLGNAASFLHEWRFLSATRRDDVLERRREYERRFRRVIEDGIASGEFRDVDAKLATTWLLSSLNGIAGWYRPDGRRSQTEIANAFADLILSGLSANRRTDS